MKASRLGAGIGSVVLLSALFMTQANASTVPDDPTLAATESLSLQRNIPFTLAQSIIDDQRVVNDLINYDGNAIDLGITADIWFETGLNGQIVNLRTDDPEIREMFAALPLSSGSHLMILDEPTLSSQLDDPNADSFAETAVDLIPGLQGMYVRITDGTLVLQVDQGETRQPRIAINSISGFDNVVIERVPPSSDTVNIRGGAAMGSCTSGFPARNGSQIGVVTAAHCPNNVRLYNGVSTVLTASIPTVRRATSARANSDIAFQEAAQGTMTRTFFGLGTANAVTMGNPQTVAQGTQVCSRGMTNGWRCGSVTSTTYRPTWNNACAGLTCNAVFNSVSVGTAGGDSGGPWVNGSNPIGVHKGGSTFQSIYSRIGFLPSGVTLG
jgi:streptogrisin C